MFSLLCPTIIYPNGQLQRPWFMTFVYLLHFESCIDMFKVEEPVPVFFKNDVTINVCGSLSELNLRYSQIQVLYCSHSGN